MDNATISQPNIVNAASTPAPAPAPAPAATPEVPIVAAPSVQMANGGSTMADGGATQGGGLKGFFASLNLIEVGFMILGVAALTYTIHYYRFKVKQDKMINSDLQRQIDELKMNMQSSMKGRYKTL